MRKPLHLGLSLVLGLVIGGPAAAQIDRYGGSLTPRPADVGPIYANSAYAGPRAAPGRALWWPGKSAQTAAAGTADQVPPTPIQAAYAPPAVMPAPVAYAPRQPAAPQPAAPRDDGFTPLYGPPAQPAPLPTPALPTSIYATPPAPLAQANPGPAPSAAAPQAVAQNTPRRADGPRFYSVHRDFGIAPDAAPIPPQFFTATADLSEPPADNDRERRIVTGSDGQRTTVIRRSSNSGAD